MSSATVAGTDLSADQVGRLFVDQYYMVQKNLREMAHEFYKEHSLLGRPDAGGNMEYTRTIDGINEKMLSMDYFVHQVKTVDTQSSLGNGLVVLVTGELERGNGSKRDFSQSFFLAPQDNGYFVLSDILRYVGEVDHQHGLHASEDGSCVPPTIEHAVLDAPVEPQHEVPGPLEGTKDAEELLSENSGVSEVELPAVVVSHHTSKGSFASIIKNIEHNGLATALVHAAPTRSAPIKTERSVDHSPTSASVMDVPVLSSNVMENGNNLFKKNKNDNKESEGVSHAIYVRNLPFDITPIQLAEGFRPFGPIKPSRIQIRSNKVQGFCFGFVEFEVASAVQRAVQASPVLIGGRQVYVEVKRSQAVSRGPNSRGGGDRNAEMRGRASYGGGKGHENKHEHGGRTGGKGGYLN